MKIIFFFIGIVIIYICANLIYKQSGLYRKIHPELLNYLAKVPHELEIINLGSTYARYAFDNYSNLGIRGFNFALEHQTLDYDLRILQYYSNCLADRCIVIIPVAACLMLYMDEGSTDLQYYTLFRRSDIPRFSLKTYLLSKMPLLKDSKKILNLLKHEVLGKTKKEYISHDKEQLTSNMHKLINVWKNLFSLDDLKDISDLSNRNKQALLHTRNKLKEIVGYCLEKGFRPIIIIPPFSEYLNQFFSDEFVNEILIKNLTEIDAKIPIFDYRKDALFQDNRFFSDGGFRLNFWGSEVFMKKFLNDLTLADIRIGDIGGKE